MNAWQDREGECWMESLWQHRVSDPAGCETWVILGCTVWRGDGRPYRWAILRTLSNGRILLDDIDDSNLLECANVKRISWISKS